MCFLDSNLTVTTILANNKNAGTVLEEGSKKGRSKVPCKTDQTTKDKGGKSHYNHSQKEVIIYGKLYKCCKIKVEGGEKGDMKKIIYTKYFQCAMAIDKSDGSKWKPLNKIGKLSNQKRQVLT